MLNLKGTTEVLRVITDAAITLDVVASWIDLESGGTQGLPDSTQTPITTAATTTIVASPAAGTTFRNVVEITGANRHASLAGNVTIQFYDGTTAFQLIKINLKAGECFGYFEGRGFVVYTAEGVEKVAQGSGTFLGRTFLSAGTTFTTGTSTRRLVVKGVGGGGGGGGCSSGVAAQGAAGAGGGAGGYFEKQFDVSPSTAYTYAIGAAGTAGANTGGTGGTGGNTTFQVGATTAQGSGGTGGVGMTTGTSEIGSAGGTGGAASNGDLNAPGAPGDFGYRRSGVLGFSGAGADSEFGGGGKALTAAGAGTAGSGYGSGGGGALVLNNSAAAIGGVGTAGCIDVWEFT